MAFHLFPTQADLDELHPRTQAYLRARKAREKRRGPFGKCLGLLAQILLFSFCAICLYSYFERSATIGDGFERTLLSPFGMMAFLIVPYYLFLWRVERYFLRRFRRIHTNIKSWVNGPGFDQPELPEPPVIAAPKLHFDGDPSRN